VGGGHRLRRLGDTLLDIAQSIFADSYCRVCPYGRINRGHREGHRPRVEQKTTLTNALHDREH
jgi:hypothetical protein